MAARAATTQASQPTSLAYGVDDRRSTDRGLLEQHPNGREPVPLAVDGCVDLDRPDALHHVLTDQRLRGRVVILGERGAVATAARSPSAMQHLTLDQLAATGYVLSNAEQAAQSECLSTEPESDEQLDLITESTRTVENTGPNQNAAESGSRVVKD